MTRTLVTTCDRCDKQVVNDVRLIANGMGLGRADIHLCIDCGKDFDAWMKETQRAVARAKRGMPA